MQSSWAITWSPSLPSVRMQSPAPVPRPSTVRLLMSSLRSPGYAYSSLSFAHLCVALLWFTATTSALCTCLPTPFSTSAPNMWRSIYTSFGSAWPPVKSEFSMSRWPHSTPTSSPRACPLQSSRSSGPAWTSSQPTIRLPGGVRHICVPCMRVYLAWLSQPCLDYRLD